MAVLTYPLNGINYNAEDAEAYLCTRESGVYSAENNFAIKVSDVMQVSVGPGIAWIKNEEFAGKVIKNSEETAIDVPIADGTFGRIDRVVIHFDKAANATSIILKQGTAANIPSAPPIVRDGIIYELGLYEIFVGAGVLKITAADIKNTMLDENVCGLMRDGVTSIPTETLQAQAEDLIKRIKTTLDKAVAEELMPHAITHSIGGDDELSPTDIGAVSFFAQQSLTADQKRMARENIGAGEKNIVALSGNVDVIIENGTEYTFGSVTSLKITGNINDAHGFIGFASSVPSVSISGFNGMSGDDISSAKAREIWEFSCEDGYAIWKNWTNATVEASANGTIETDGGYYIPSIDADGNLSWTGSKPNMITPLAVNIKGEKGEKGEKGDPGESGSTEEIEEKLLEIEGKLLNVTEKFRSNTQDATPAQVADAISKGNTVLISHTDSTYGIIMFASFAVAAGLNIVAGSVTFEFNGALYNAGLVGDLQNNTWNFAVNQLATDKTATAVNLSGFETEGKIVETYSDGTSLEYSFEFDSEGNPTKITDSDGNETVLTW